jgi:hypothetical protein
MIAGTVSHLYQAGDKVILNSRSGHFLKSHAAFTVTALLPPLGSDFQYKIKGIGELYERVALEHHLTRAPSYVAKADSFFKSLTGR